MEFYIKKGSTLPVISYEVTEDGINNLDSLLGSQNYVCTFSLLRKDGSFVIFKKPAQVQVRNEGEKFGLFLTYQFSKKETSTSGDYYGQFHLNSVDGERFFKRDGKIPIFILDAISDNELCCKSSNLKDDEQVITGTPKRTPTNTPTFTFTPTNSPTLTLTPTNTITNTLTRTLTPTMTVTNTNTLTPTLSPTSTLTPTYTPTLTVTPTFTVTPTKTITFWDPSNEAAVKSWWDASDQTTLTNNTGGISQMRDKASGFNLEQFDQFKRPATGNTVNGLNTLSFDGTENMTTLGNRNFGILDGNMTIVSAIQILYVDEKEDAIWSINDQLSTFKDVQLIRSEGSGSNANYYGALDSRNLGWSQPTQQFSGGPYSGNNINSVQLDFDDNECKGFMNGSSVLTITDYIGPVEMNSCTFGLFTDRGTTRNLGGTFCEMLIMTSNDDLTRQKAEGYLAYKWGMRDLLPSDHPYKNSRPTIDPPPTPTNTATNTLTPSPTIISVSAGPTFDLSSQETNPRDLTFNNDGTKMFIAGVTGDDILEYTLSVGYDLSSTVNYVQSVSVPSNPSAVRFNDDGTKMFVNGYNQNKISYYNLTTAFDVSTAVYQGASPSTSGRDNDTFGMDFSDDGTKVYITGNQNDKIYEYDLPSAYDVTSLTFVQDFYVGNLDIEPFGIEFCNGGTRLFIVGTRNNGVLQFELSTPFDISTSSYVGFYFIGGNPSGIHIDPDGTKMFIVGTASDQVKSYTLSQPCRLVVPVTPTPTPSQTSSQTP